MRPQARRCPGAIVIDQQHLNAALVSQMQSSRLLARQIVEFNAKIARWPLSLSRRRCMGAIR
jgi:hypothetical protein